MISEECSSSGGQNLSEVLRAWEELAGSEEHQGPSTSDLYTVFLPAVTRKSHFDSFFSRLVNLRLLRTHFPRLALAVKVLLRQPSLLLLGLSLLSLSKTAHAFEPDRGSGCSLSTSQLRRTPPSTM